MRRAGNVLLFVVNTVLLQTVGDVVLFVVDISCCSASPTTNDKKETISNEVLV